MSALSMSALRGEADTAANDQPICGGQLASGQVDLHAFQGDPLR